MECKFVGPHTGRQCTREHGHSGIHNTWGGDPIVETLPNAPTIFELTYRSSNSGGYRRVEAPSYGEAVLSLFATLKDFDHFPKHAHIDAQGNVTFRWKTIGQIV